MLGILIAGSACREAYGVKSRGLQSGYSCGPENHMLKVQVKIKYRSEHLRDVPARLRVAGLHPFRLS